LPSLGWCFTPTGSPVIAGPWVARAGESRHGLPRGRQERTTTTLLDAGTGSNHGPASAGQCIPGPQAGELRHDRLWQVRPPARCAAGQMVTSTDERHPKADRDDALGRRRGRRTRRHGGGGGSTPDQPGRPHRVRHGQTSPSRPNNLAQGGHHPGIERRREGARAPGGLKRPARRPGPLRADEQTSAGRQPRMGGVLAAASWCYSFRVRPMLAIAGCR